MPITDPDPTSDAALAVALAAGDRGALAGIYDRHADRLYDTAAAMLRDRDEAADAVHDVFVLAAERIDQLRDPERLRPWLFAILRNQVYTRSARRSRTRPTDMGTGETDMSDRQSPVASGDPGDDVAVEELAVLVRDAAAGLDERDQLVLEYSVRQQLSGDDLAAALGVSIDQSYVLLHRMRERVERALGALTVARMGRKECADLADVLQGWDGTFSVLIRKRVARHVERCDTCADTKRRFAALSLVGAAPAFVAPADLRDRVLSTLSAGVSGQRGDRFDAPAGFPSLPRRSLRRLVAASAAAILLLVAVLWIGTSVLGDASVDAEPSASADTLEIGHETRPGRPSPTTVGSASAERAPSTAADTSLPSAQASSLPSTATEETPPPPTTLPADPPVLDGAPVTTPPAPVVAAPPSPAAPPAPPVTTGPPLAAGRLTMSRQAIDFGSGSASEQLVLTNSGGQPLDFSVGGSGGGFAADPVGGSLGAGQSVPVTVTFDRAGAAEGSHGRALAISSSASGGGSLQLAAVVDRSPTVQVTQGPPNPVCPDIAHPTVVARVVDSTTASVVLSWSGPGSPGSAAMSRSGDVWSAAVTIAPTVEGNWTFTVRATDAAGHVGTTSGSFVVDCPTPG